MTAMLEMKGLSKQFVKRLDRVITQALRQHSLIVQ